MLISLKKFKVISCEALARPLYHFSAQSPHQIDLELLHIGLHDQPDTLRETIQECIDRTPENTFDAILLGYGLCGRALDGIFSQHTPLVISRAHDCITILLGSRDAYQQQHQIFPGTFWYTQDFLERSTLYSDALVLGAGAFQNLDRIRQEYVEKYGKDNADYLIETMHTWQNQYQRAVILENELGLPPQVRLQAQQSASQNGWTLESLTGNLRLIKDLLFGDWHEDFLLVPAGYQIEMTTDHAIITAVKRAV